jgi:trans-2,3-dihydro-3-hydroxyanthranilate isomerase
MMDKSMQRRYAIWDVFTSRPLAGNPLAVVLDSEGLSTEAMQAIACEFNLSETVFVLPPRLNAHTAYIRIFTPRTELPFAGHPTIGAALQIAEDRNSGAAADCDALIVLEENIGSVRVGVAGRRGSARYAEFDVPKLPEEAGAPTHDDRLAVALGLAPVEIGFANHKPVAYGAGTAFTFVPVRDLGVMRRARIVHSYWEEAFHATGGKVLVYCRETIHHNATLHVRMFAPDTGIPEDPATGSAAAALSAVIHRFDQLPEGTSDATIEQGIEMGRPSEIKLEIEIGGREIKRVRIGGYACLVMRGQLYV